MKISTAIFAACIIASQASNAAIKEGTGNHYIETCPSGSATSQSCFFWMAGIVQGISFFANTIDENYYKNVKGKGKSCIPDGVIIGQGTRVVDNYMRDNPQHNNQQLPVIVHIALIKAFPC